MQHPITLYKHCLDYITIIQYNSNLLLKHLDHLIFHYEHYLTLAINDSIHDINDPIKLRKYKMQRNYFITQFKINISHTHIKPSPNSSNEDWNKFINYHILKYCYRNQIEIIKNILKCILFVDKVLNIFNVSDIKYIVKGDLIINGEIIYNNVIEDDTCHLPPKKRTRK